MTLGDRIKKRRNEKTMSLRELAEKVEVSASFLSQIEQGKASPSIENLKKIANELDIRVSNLIEDDESNRDVILMKKSERYLVESLNHGTKIALLTTPNREKQMEPIYYEIKPGGESGRNFYNHPGEEFVLVVEGTLDVFINDKKYVLEDGDSLYFNSTQNHKFKNNYDKLVKVVWVVTPPTF